MRLFCWAALIAVVGCGEGHHHDKSSAKLPPKVDEAVLLPALLEAKPAEAISVPEAMKKNAGESVVVTGVTPPEKVAPFNPALATFAMLSPEDAARPEVVEEFQCDDAATCPRCKEILQKYAVRVELVDLHDKVLASSLQGFRGIQPGSTITVEGTVKHGGKDGKTVSIVAKKFYPG